MSYKKLSISLFMALIPGIVCLGQNSARSFRNPADSDQGLFYLSIVLNDRYNPDLRALLPVKLNKQFKFTVETNGLKTTISGTILDPINDRYPLDLYVFEWESVKSNLVGKSDLQLELDRPLSYGTISSFVYNRTLTLSRNRPECLYER